MRLFIAAQSVDVLGGMERYVQVILPALRERGEVHVVAPNAPSREDGVERIEWPDEHEPPSPAAARATAEAMSLFRPDVAVAHNVMDAAVVEALRAAPRMAYHVHDHRPFCPNGDRVFPRTENNCGLALGNACVLHALLSGCAYGPRLRTLTLIRGRERLRNAINAADTVVVASSYVRDRAVLSGVAKERIATIPAPLASEAYGDMPSGASRSIVFAGRIVPQKGLASLVGAVARIATDRRPRIRAFGDGPAVDTARQKAAQLSVELDTPGTVDAATLRGAIDAASLVAVPSLWAEPFGYSGIEAFARRRAVVAYDVGGITSWLKDGRNGYAIPRGDEAALARALEQLCNDDRLRAKLENNARVDAERYRVGRIADELYAAYRL